MAAGGGGGGGGGLGGSIGLHMLHLVLEVGLEGGELGLELVLVGLRVVERGLQHRRRIGRRLGRGRRRRLERGDVERRIDRRAGAQQPRGHQQQKQKQQAEQQRAQPGRPAEPRRQQTAGALADTAGAGRAAASAPAAARRPQARGGIGLVAPGRDHRLAIDQVDEVVGRARGGELQRAADQARLFARRRLLSCPPRRADGVEMAFDGRQRCGALGSRRDRRSGGPRRRAAYQSMPSPASRSCGSASRLAGPSPRRRRITASSWPATACRGSPRTPRGRTPSRVVRIRVGLSPMRCRCLSYGTISSGNPAGLCPIGYRIRGCFPEGATS